MPTRSVPPLLAEPAPPFLVLQETSPQGAADLAETARWRYRVQYRHEHRPQDEVTVTASFNVPSDGATVVDAPARFERRVTVQLDYSDDGERIEALRLTRAGDEAGASGGWPDVEYLTPAPDAVVLGAGTGDGDVRTYTLESPVDAEAWPGIGLTWSGLGVASAQNARASLQAVRNRGTDGGGTIYRTAVVDAADAVAPLNRRPHDVDIGDLGDTVEAALDAMFGRLFGDDAVGQRVSIGFYYGYSPVPAGALDDEPSAALTIWLPIGLVVDRPIAATTTHEIAQALAAWHDANRPPSAPGAWAFSLVAFSRLDETPRPLLDLARLVYRLR